VSQDTEQYNFYRALGVAPDAATEEIAEAHKQLVAAPEPDEKPDEQKRAAALARIIANAALDVLSDEKSRQDYNAKLEEFHKTASYKSKVEAKRAGKLQEEQSIEEDMKLQKATVNYEAARSALADFYYDRLFDEAKKSRFETIPQEKLMEWLSADRAEAVRKAEQKGRRASFRIDWQGFASVQDTRKKRTEEIAGLVEELVTKLPLP